jgi:hypothetical protein
MHTELALNAFSQGLHVIVFKFKIADRADLNAGVAVFAVIPAPG